MKFPKEVEHGNIEYKLKITTNDRNRIEQLASQMKWRINEGINEAFYYIGIDDEGNIEGISQDNYTQTIKNLSKITKIINAKIENIENKSFNGNSYYIIRIISYQNKKNTKNIIFIGPQNSGKSTIIGNLINNIKDDGKGKSKQYVLNHKHEIFSGTTSSVSIKNFDIDNYDESINLIDTPGKLKYRKTTISALSKYNPCFIFLVFNPLNLVDIDLYLNLVKFFDIEYTVIFTNKDIYLNFDNLKLDKFDKGKLLEISNTTRFGYSKLISKVKSCKIKCGIENSLIQICDILNVPNMNKIYTGLTFSDINLDGNFYLHSPEKVKCIKFNSIFFLDKPVNKVKKNCLITFTLKNDNYLINKTDIIISDSKIMKSYKFINVKCNENINSNQGTCIFSNQYVPVRIEYINNFLKLTPLNGKFINVSKKIFLKINEKYHFCDLHV